MLFRSAYRAFRRTETTAAESLTQLLVTVSLSALLSVAFLALFVLAAALPLYSRLTER